MFKLALKYSIILSFFTFLPFCTKKKSGYAPSILNQPLIHSITSNGSDTLYCSLAGGCSVVVVGENFYTESKVYIGNAECTGEVLTDVTVSGQALKQISCTAGAGRSGVFDVYVKNFDAQISKFIDGIDPATMQFSYATFIYIGNSNSPGEVLGYAQNPLTGAIGPIAGSPFSIAGQNNTYGVVLHPKNTFIYSANVSSGSISIYSINPSSGSLTSNGAVLSIAGNSSSGANGLAIDPAGKFLYVTNFTANNISGFSIASDGSLTSIPGSPFSAGTGSTLNGIAVDPSGKFVYAAAMGGSGSLLGYSIDETTGALTAISGSPFSNTFDATPLTGDGVNIHPNGKWIYMGLAGQNKMAAFSIDQTTGVLTMIQAPVSNGGFANNQGAGSQVHPNGKFLYSTAFQNCGAVCAMDKQVIIYSIDQTTGSLTLISPTKASSVYSSLTTAGGPNDIRIDTNGEFAYTCNSYRGPSINAYRVDGATGALTALPTPSYPVTALSFGPGIMVITKEYNGI